MNNLTNIKYGLQHETGQNSSWKVESVKQIEYEVARTDSLFSEPKKYREIVGRLAPNGGRRLLVMDRNVSEIYGERIENSFREWDTSIKSVVLEADEVAKNWQSVERVLVSRF